VWPEVYEVVECGKAGVFGGTAVINENIIYIEMNSILTLKKHSRYRPGVAQRVPGS
jgi:hypothetical protein